MKSHFLLLAFVSATWAQPAFEAASIRPSADAQPSIEVTARTVTLRSQPLIEYLAWAYKTQRPMLIGPAWLAEARFDIRATTGSDATESEMRLMMQELLADRFKLVLHRETRLLPILEMTVSKGGHKLVPTGAEIPPSFRAENLGVDGVGATMQPLVETISTFLSTPVLDRTGLEGKFTYSLEIRSFVTDDVRRNAAVQLPVVIAQALQEQAGLRLVPVKASIEVLVIDRIENQPTEN